MTKVSSALLLIHKTALNTNLTTSELLSAVELTAPYNTNTQEVTLNSADSILSEEAATEGVDPFFQYTYLGDSIEDGIFGWLAFGIDATQSSTVNAAANYYATGGVASSSGSGMGGGGGAPPSGTGNSSSIMIPDAAGVSTEGASTATLSTATAASTSNCKKRRST